MKEISLVEFDFNPVKAFGKNWMALTAGTKEKGCNTMCVSWGHFGTLWDRGQGALTTAVVYARPQRYTKEFLDREDYFTLCIFPENMKKALSYIGSHSGRDGDKITAAGLTPVYEDGITYFEEAESVLVCRKLYSSPLLKEGFCDKSIIENDYKDGDFHTLYVGEIVRILVK